MRHLGNCFCALVVLCAACPVVSFLPSFSPARARAGRSVGVSCTQGTTSRQGTSRAPVSSSRLQAVEDEDRHVMPEGQRADADTADRKRKIRSRWSKGQGSWSKSATGRRPGRNDLEGGAEGGLGQTVAAAALQAEGAASVDKEDIMMAELGQAGGEAGEPSKTNLTKKRLKKFYLKDFEDSSWTVGIQWKNRPFRIETTKVALKADGTVVWLDKGKGSWRLRTRTRDLVFYRDFFWNWNGKRIYAAKLLDNTCDMYLEGEIKGWGPFQSLDTMGSFQAVRRGITIDENTPRPPWESRPPPPEPEVTDGKRRKPNKEILADVDLD